MTTALADHRDLTTPTGAIPLGQLDTSSTVADHDGLTIRPHAPLTTDQRLTDHPVGQGADHAEEIALTSDTAAADQTSEAGGNRGRKARRSKAEKLRESAEEAARLRTYKTHPDVAALTIERIAARVSAVIWLSLLLGLLFTMSNVAEFAGSGAHGNTVKQVNAWLLDPMVSLVLIASLIGCSVLARYGIKATAWVNVAKWGALAATYAMNTWSAWVTLIPAQIVLHSVPPAIVFLAAELLTDLRHLLTTAVAKAHEAAVKRIREQAERDQVEQDAQRAASPVVVSRPRADQPRRSHPAPRRTPPAGQVSVPTRTAQVDTAAGQDPASPSVDTRAATDQERPLHLAGGTDQERLERMVSELDREFTGEPAPGRPAAIARMRERGYDGWSNAGHAGAAVKELKKRRGEQAG